MDQSSSPIVGGVKARKEYSPSATDEINVEVIVDVLHLQEHISKNKAPTFFRVKNLSIYIKANGVSTIDTSRVGYKKFNQLAMYNIWVYLDFSS